MRDPPMPCLFNVQNAILRNLMSLPQCYHLNEVLNLASLNINKLITHIDQIIILLAHNEIDILSINETKLNETTSDNEVNVSGYDIIRRDKITNGGGGVCFCVKS